MIEYTKKDIFIYFLPLYPISRKKSENAMSFELVQDYWVFRSRNMAKDIFGETPLLKKKSFEGIESENIIMDQGIDEKYECETKQYTSSSEASDSEDDDDIFKVTE